MWGRSALLDVYFIISLPTMEIQPPGSLCIKIKLSNQLYNVWIKRRRSWEGEGTQSPAGPPRALKARWGPDWVLVVGTQRKGVPKTQQ